MNKNTNNENIYKNKRFKCATCKYHYFKKIDQGYVCVNSDSEYCTEWTDDNDFCSEYEEKE